VKDDSDRSLEAWARLILGDRYGKSTNKEGGKAMNRTFYIAGVQFHDLPKVAKDIEVGSVLVLEPEPSNKYDPNAVKIIYLHFEKGAVMLGYVPKKFSAEATAFLEISDLECVVEEINPAAKSWEMCKVTVKEVEG